MPARAGGVGKVLLVALVVVAVVAALALVKYSALPLLGHVEQDIEARLEYQSTHAPPDSPARPREGGSDAGSTPQAAQVQHPPAHEVPTSTPTQPPHVQPVDSSSSSSSSSTTTSASSTGSVDAAAAPPAVTPVPASVPLEPASSSSSASDTAEPAAPAGSQWAPQLGGDGLSDDMAQRDAKLIVEAAGTDAHHAQPQRHAYTCSHSLHPHSCLHCIRGGSSSHPAVSRDH